MAAKTTSSSTRASTRSSRNTSPRRKPSGAARTTGYKSLADTALDFLSVPDKVLADENRYVTITGCVYRFCPARGLLWVDLGSPHPLVVFAAIDWIKDNKTPDQPDAEYTLWVFANHSHRPRAHSRQR